MPDEHLWHEAQAGSPVSALNLRGVYLGRAAGGPSRAALRLWRKPGRHRPSYDAADVPGRARSRARNEGNLRLTRPCSANLQVSGGVGREDEQIDHLARRTGGATSTPGAELS